MFGLVGSDVRNGSKDVGSMSSSALDTISVVYTAATCFTVAVKVLEVVVEID